MGERGYELSNDKPPCAHEAERSDVAISRELPLDCHACQAGLAMTNLNVQEPPSVAEQPKQPTPR